MGILNNFNEERHNRTLIEEGREEGREEGLIKIVMFNLDKGRTIEDIADFTGESVETIKEIESRILTMA